MRTVRVITIPPGHIKGIGIVQEVQEKMAEKISSENLIFLMKKISIALELFLEKVLGTKDLSGTQVYLLVYILRHHPEGTYITEVCREVGISKATVSVLIKKLREKGYLCFQNHSEDIRKKKVLPTEQLMEESKELLARVERLEQAVCEGMNPEEKEEFWKMEKKILLQLGEMEERQEVTI